jgi:hypothetical protein
MIVCVKDETLSVAGRIGSRLCPFHNPGAAKTSARLAGIISDGFRAARAFNPLAHQLELWQLRLLNSAVLIQSKAK